MFRGKGHTNRSIGEGAGQQANVGELDARLLLELGELLQHWEGLCQVRSRV